MITAWCHLLRVLAFLCMCTKSLHIDLDLDICSAHLELRSACLLFLCTALIFQELMKKRSLKKSFFARFFVFVPKKNCIFIRIIRSVHAMLRTCKKWHHVHAMLCTRFCIKKKWTSHSSQIIIVSEQGKTITRRVAKFATSYSVFHFPAIWSVTLNKPWNPIGHFVFSVASPSRVFGLVYQKPWVIPFFFLDTSLD